MLPLQHNHVIDSQKFSVGPHSFRLRLCPAGWCEAEDTEEVKKLHKECVAIFIELLSVATVTARIYFTVAGMEHALFWTMKSGSESGSMQKFKRSVLSDAASKNNDTLVFGCEVRIYDARVVPTIQEEADKAAKALTTHLYSMLFSADTRCVVVLEHTCDPCTHFAHVRWLRSDAVLCAGSERIPVHRCILAARSPVLAAQLKQEPTATAFEVDDIAVDDLKELLRCGPCSTLRACGHCAM